MSDDTRSWIIRQATAEDIPAMAWCRKAMFADMGVAGESDLELVASEFSRYAAETMRRGEYLGWLAEVNGVAVAGIGAVLQHFPPSMRNLTGTVGYLMNLYVVPTWRRKGLARELVQTAIARLAEDGVSVVSLHASDAGRPLYLSLGFEPSSEMRLFLDRA